MAKQFESLDQDLKTFIERQKIFFVGTAMQEGRVNVSPKGMDTFRVLDDKHIVWLNLTGSGNETATHLQGNDRMTIMFCAFEGKPLILRLYGQAKVYHERDAVFQEHIDLFPVDTGARQIIVLDIDLVQTSCGYAVPLMDFKEERTILKTWAKKQGKDKIRDYWKDRNATSLDGLDTGMVKE